MTLSRTMRLISLIMGCLAIPFIGMRFSNQIVWSGADFILAAILLFIVGMGYELAHMHFGMRWQRALIVLGVSLIVVLCWAELAVGIFGSPFAGS